MLGWLFLPIYIASGVRGLVNSSTSLIMFNIPHTVHCSKKYFNVLVGDNYARVSSEEIWRQKNTDIYCYFVFIYLHLHKNIGKWRALCLSALLKKSLFRINDLFIPFYSNLTISFSINGHFSLLTAM